MGLLLGWIAGWLSHASYSVPPQRIAAIKQVSPALVPRAKALPTAVPPVSNSRPVAVSMPQADAWQAFQSLLQQGRFTEAVTAWPERWHQQARALVFSDSYDLQVSGRQQDSFALLRAYISRFPDDDAAVLHQAEMLHQTRDFQRETFVLMDMLFNTAAVASLSTVKSRLQRAIKSNREQLMQARNYRDLLAFYRQLSSRDGSNQDYILMQARVLIAMGQLAQASSLLQPLLFDASTAQQAKLLATKIQGIASAQYQTAIPLQRSGEHFLVPVSINGKAPLYLLLDTGASITLIQKTAGDQDKQRIKLQTANGSITVPTKTVASLSLGRFTLHDVHVGLISEPVARQADGLLGMDLLKHFEFFIDQKVPALHLSQRSGH